MSKELTEKQKKFIDALFGEAMGDHRLAMDIAGYSPNTTWRDVTANLNEEILQASKEYLSMHAPKAAVAMVSGVDDPTQLGIRDKLAASKELLDRVGLIKTEKVQVEASGGVMILPPKKKERF